ncbi:hypothetical protein BRAT_10350 [Leptospira interrogans serovar Bratislava]|nr:hypothetical protein BRAT_10350 [Leptospira interrogans serovar Bratislava]KLO77529.1 Uncharacterized protein AAY48_1337 [Leptospira interrogans serovar Muenchen]MCR8640113.1 hypothetical protein [Leptospira interrogans serovar Ricardi]
MWELSQIVNLPVKLYKLWELLGNTKRIILQSDFAQIAVLRPSSKFKSHFTTRTHENSTKLLTAEFTKKIVVLKKYRKFGIYYIFKQDQNIQIFETI